jgi:hypothetical protein
MEPELWVRCPKCGGTGYEKLTWSLPECWRCCKRGFVQIPFDEAVERMALRRWERGHADTHHPKSWEAEGAVVKARLRLAAEADLLAAVGGEGL